jgi:hypothetical protein
VCLADRLSLSTWRDRESRDTYRRSGARLLWAPDQGGPLITTRPSTTVPYSRVAGGFSSRGVSRTGFERCVWSPESRAACGRACGLSRVSHSDSASHRRSSVTLPERPLLSRHRPLSIHLVTGPVVWCVVRVVRTVVALGALGVAPTRQPTRHGHAGAAREDFRNYATNMQ